jgi:pyruvate kinase
MRHTKIIATIGPASDSAATLDALIAAGTDIFRLNFSHGTHETHKATFERIREASRRAYCDVAILQDLGGPKIRTGRLEGGKAITLAPGDAVTIATGDALGGPGRLYTTFDGLAKSVRTSDRLLLADGRVELRVESTTGTEIHATVVEGGEIGEHKGINAPGVPLPTSAITPKDIDDLKFGLSLGVDMVALSFVQTADDVQKARQVMIEADAGDVPLIAKLERPLAIEHLEEILSACDAVMVARGDLGLEMPFERVPRAQKEITRRARLAGKPVIVATQVLESLTVEARPTRAEVNDAANAVEDGVDVIMLAGETASGAHPVQAVKTLNAIIGDAETSPLHRVEAAVTASFSSENYAKAMCEAAATLADHSAARAIVAVTRGGATARALSAMRPQAPIIAATEREVTGRRLQLFWGVVPLCMPIGENLDEASARIGARLIERGLVAAGATAVFVSISDDLSRRDANYVKIQRL